jgi:hypothetical protein
VEQSSPRTIYSARPEATPEVELSVLASIYKLILNSANKNAAGVTSTNGDDAMKGSKRDRATNHSTAKPTGHL